MIRSGIWQGNFSLKIISALNNIVPIARLLRKMSVSGHNFPTCKWVHTIVPERSDFTLDNLPWGVYANEKSTGSICTRIGDHGTLVMCLSVTHLRSRAKHAHVS